MQGHDRKLLILDLDETQIFASEQPLSRPHDFVVDSFFVYKRPHLDDFLCLCADYYDLAVWSSGSTPYVEEAVGKLMPVGIEPVLVWSQKRCTRHLDSETHDECFLKDLKKIKRAGFDLRGVLIVDNTPGVVKRHYGNAVYVRAYLGDASDDCLPRLARFLISIHREPDVRVIEKRGW